MRRMALLILLLLALPLMIAAAQDESTLTIEPESAAVGATFTITATGLEPGQPYVIQFYYADSVVFATERTAGTDGRLSLEIFSEDSDEPGLYTVVVVNSGGQDVLSGSFTLLDTLLFTPNIFITPPTARVGQVHSVTITGLGPYETLLVEVQAGEDGPVVYSRRWTSSELGDLRVALFVSDNEGAGQHIVTATAADGQVLARGQFMALPGRAPGDVMVAPETAAAGDTVSITLDGLERVQPVTIRIVNAAGTVVHSESLRADINGILRASVTLSDTLADGTYTVRVMANPLDMLASGQFVVGQTGTEPADEASITISPESGPIGTEHTVEIEGLPPGQMLTLDVTLAATGQSVYSTTIRSSELGTYSLSLVSEEGDEPGPYTISILSGGQPLAEAVLTIEGAETGPAALTLDVRPSAGPIGTSHTVTITGLEPGETVTVQALLGTELVFSGEYTAGDDGRVMLSIGGREEDGPGTYDVVVIRNETVAAQTSIVVTAAVSDTSAQITVTPESGPIGTLHRIDVTGLERRETVLIEILHDGQLVYSAQRTADVGGSLFTNVISEEGDAPGTYTVYVLRDAGEVVQGSFSIGAPDVVTEPPDTDISATAADAQISIAPESGPIGTLHRIDVAGLERRETVTIEVTFGGQVVYTTQRTADTAGDLFLNLLSEEGDAPGPYTVRVLRAEGSTLQTTLTITSDGVAISPPEPEPEPAVVELVVTPESGPRNTLHTIVVSGLQPDESISVEILFGDASVYSAERTADENGVISVAVYSEDSDAPGIYTVNALRGGQVIATGTLTVESRPTVVITPAEGGPIGTIYSITAGGLQPQSVVTLQVRYQPTEEIVYTTTLPTDADGRATIDLVSEEGDAPGIYMVIIIEGDTPVARGQLIIGRSPADVTAVDQPAVRTISGQLSEESPVFEYSFSGQAGDQFTITLESNEFDAYLQLVDENGVVVAEDDDSAGDLNAQISTELPASGRYTVVATSVNHIFSGGTMTASGSFTLTLTTAGAAVEAHSIALNETISGSLTAENPAAQYSFSGQAGDVITIEMNADAMDAYLLLLGPDGSLVAEDDDSAGGLDARISIALPDDGRYTIIATTYSTHLGGDPGTGSFSLSLLPGDAAQTVDTGEAAPLEIGQTVSGELTAAAPQALYSFSGQAGEVVTIALDSGDFDAYLILLDADGRELTRDDDGGSGRNALISSFTLPADGSYIITATSYNSATGRPPSTGSFTLALLSGEAAVVQPLPESDLVPGLPVQGELTAGAPTAEYTFSGRAGDAVTITLDSDDFDAYLILLDASGEPVARDDDSGPGRSAAITGFVLPADGLYTVVATSYRHTVGVQDETGAFVLTFQPGAVVDLPEEPPEPLVPEGVEVDIMPGQTVRGAVSAENPFVLYNFYGRTGDVITIDMASNNFDTYLILQTEDGRDLVSDDDGGEGLNSRITGYRLPEDGLYTIVATSYNYNSGFGEASGVFTLTLMSSAYVVDDDKPFELEIPPPNYINVGDSASGTLTLEDATASYTFYGWAGDVITIDLSSADFDTYLILQDNSGQVVAFDDDGGNNRNSLIRGFTLPTSGDYVIVVTSYENAIGLQAVPGTYALLLQAGETSGKPEGLASAIRQGETVTGELTLDNPQVVYAFIGSAGETITVSMESFMLDTYLILQTADGRELTSNDDFGGSTDSRIVAFTLPADGTYLILATSYHYVNNFDVPTGQFTLTLNTVASQSIEYPGSVSGSLHPEQELVVYTFSGQEGDTIFISMPSDTLDTFLILQGSDGQDLTRDDDSGGNLNALIAPFTLPYDGDYIIIATSYNTISGYGLSQGGEFTLVVERLEIVPLEMNSPLEAEFTPDDLMQFFSIELEAGSLLHISVDSGGSIDTSLTLTDPDNYQAYYDDDSGPGLDPEVHNFIVNLPGTYTLTVRPFMPGLSGSVTITVLDNTPTLAPGEPQRIVLNHKQYLGLARIEGLAGQEITLSINVLHGSPELFIIARQDGETIDLADFSGEGPFSFSFTLPADGTAIVEMEDYRYGSVLELTLSGE